MLILKLKGESMKGKLPYAMDIVQAVPFIVASCVNTSPVSKVRVG